MYHKLKVKLIKLATFLDGKKTYIVATLGGAINFINFLNDSGVFYFNIPHLAQINVILAFIGASTLRAAIKKSNDSGVLMSSSSDT